MSEHIIEVEYDTLNGTFTQMRHEEVVRCRDCRWYRAPLPSLGNVAMCKRNVVSAIPVDEDGFCAWGERSDA